METNHSPTSKYRWFILSIGVLAQIAFAIGFAGIPTSATIMRADYHFTVSQLGFVLGCMGLGVAISEIVWGILTDKLGDKIVLIIGLVSMGTVYLIMYFGFVPEAGNLPSYLSVGVLLILAGAVGGSINSSSGRAVMSWFQDSERGFAMSIRQTAIPVGAAIGSLLIPYLASVHGFDMAFLTLATISYIIAICVGLWLVEQKIPKTSTGASHAEGKSPIKRLSVWNVALAGAALTFPQMAVLTFSPVFLKDQHHLSLVAVSIIGFCISLGGGVLRIVTGRITDRHQNRRKVMSIIAIIAGITSIVLGFLYDQNAYIVVALLIIVGLAGNAWHGIGYTEIAVNAGVRYAGTALGMMGTTVFGVSFIIPYIIPHILKLSSWNGVWIVVGVASAIAWPLMALRVRVPVKKEGVSNGKNFT
ncbi:MFS transporter [Marininema halotolerans]|uniref:Sugar phosphate permease n=1 Tax=Marininema halotolerans TaxID=1155944 RepID=A0A1I6R3B7_9BACL|nr:MFS transporter [Marininema halotolerans]SFS59183.1 Sugar phosphate permease [Marininema halotolerans]